MAADRKLMLIDGHALVHRAFHAVSPLSTSQGEQINAVYGFASMLLKAIEAQQPTHIVMAMDRPVPTFRHERYSEYKATRPKTAPELAPQFARVREVADAMHIPICELDGFEADDVLGTLSKQAAAQQVPAVIVTGDLDTLQLVNDYVTVLAAVRGMGDPTTYTRQAVTDRYGLRPDQLPDFKGLVGDTSDNIPGVPGVGEKTASRLLAQYGSLEGIYEHIGDLKGKVRDALEGNREQAFESRHLATIVTDVPVTLDLAGAARADVDRVRIINLFRELEFRSLIERLQVLMPAAEARPPDPSDIQQLTIFGEAETPSPSTAPAPHEEEGTVRATIGLLEGEPGSTTSTETHVVRDADDLRLMTGALRSAGRFAVDTETTSTDPLTASLVGLSFSTSPGTGWYVPVGHAEGQQLPLQTVLDDCRQVLEDDALEKVGHNLKYDYTVLLQHRIHLRGPQFDTMIAAYLINPVGRGLSLSKLAMERLGVEMTPIEALIGKGKGQLTMDQVDIAMVAAYAGADADITLRLRELLAPQLDELGLADLFQTIEMPLVPVLAEMERTGVCLDTSVLAEMSSEMTREIGALEQRIYGIAGRAFNISSTQQLGQILFQQLGLPSGRRTKTGYSTDSEVLEALRGKHEIVDLILEYRQLIKLKNTYIDALPSLLSPLDGRIHTDFNQTIAATGRLSSSNPNLQNIPIRSEIGRRIRRSFVPCSPGHVLLAADYSQIELRILAAMSHDERLVHAFTSGEDVHRATASAVFGVGLDEVTSDQRRIAKVVNFGIIYGIGEQRLAHETGISRQEAGQFIAQYNQTYSGVKLFMDNLKKQAALYGYVATLFNRRRPTPDVHASNPGIRAAAERAAINMPIQGTAADIIKIAMIRLHDRLAEQYPEARMVLQVHDELVFDVPREQVAEIARVVRDEMIGAASLDVPLDVEVKAGPDWYDMSPVDID